MDRKKIERDEETARQYKNPFFRTPKHLPERFFSASPDPRQLSLLDKECYWKAILSSNRE